MSTTTDLPPYSELATGDPHTAHESLIEDSHQDHGTRAATPCSEIVTGDPLTPHESLIQDSHHDYSPRASLPLRSMEEWEFEYKIERNSNKGKNIASLKVLAPAAYSDNIPTFCGAGPVKGSVNLYFTEPETITSVVLSVRGGFLPGDSDGTTQLTLFNVSNTLWSKDSAEETRDPLLCHKKLRGTHSWPFSIIIPEKIQLTGGSTTRSAAETTEHFLPQTFMERVFRASIQYKVILHIGRGKFKTDHNINCTFGYFLLIRPPPFPALKTLAYLERTPLLDPAVDIEGWIPAKKVEISGILFKSRPVAIDCELFLSAPLIYTRGSVIPLYVRMKSSEKPALDLLATHKALIVRLQRRIKCALSPKPLKNTQNYRTGKDEYDIVEAVWWPVSPEQGSFAIDTQTHTVCLNGELQLRGDLVPSSTLPVFTVKYNVSLRSVDAPGFKTAKPEKILVEHPVDIVTSFAAGPLAIRHVHPGSACQERLAVT
ncbi:hypothetical protein D9619_012590 [Psilocybe cf. subviscida]|uniref:Arrestin-like N-terminal domain-containing protein n=1 Tax=Psilocybe cf. subviscida TaxID=2480587 RepID=A0A8H5B6Z7_9AGAR|nr:hypothetical protein D9619_012590 [Psilocybe cf. subviscida]